MRFTTKRVDLLFTERFYTTPGDQPVKVRCGRCGGNIIFTKNQDDPKDRFYCFNASKFNACFDKQRYEIDKMLPSAIAVSLDTDYNVDDKEELGLVVIEEATDGVTRFGKTRPMVFSEKLDYFKKGLDHLRDKIARGEKT